MVTQMCSNRAIVDSLECCMDDLVECFEDFVKKSLILIFLGIGVIVGLLCYLLKMVSERPPLNNAIAENTTHTQNKVNEMIERNKKVKEELKLNKLEKKKYKETDKIDNHIVPVDRELHQPMNQEINDPLNPEMNQPTNEDISQTVDTDIKTDLDIDKNTAAVNTSNVPILPSFDENVLRDVGLSSCSKYGCGGTSNTHIYSPSRVPVPSLPTSSSKHKLVPCLRKRSLNKSNLPSLQICPRVTKPGSCCSMCCNDEPKRADDFDRQMLNRNPQ